MGLLLSGLPWIAAGVRSAHGQQMNSGHLLSFEEMVKPWVAGARLVKMDVTLTAPILAENGSLVHQGMAVGVDREQGEADDFFIPRAHPAAPHTGRAHGFAVDAGNARGHGFTGAVIVFKERHHRHDAALTGQPGVAKVVGGAHGLGPRVDQFGRAQFGVRGRLDPSWHQPKLAVS